ncbi:HEPN domain-containing protein [Verrucomicrobium sp. 3C]|uniref:HEPN domain-containing protein n=1 Tax=Verrucomicrobium sp. 3C TaxID=1134055 RepID=UPI00037E3658|nr:HEPN domain-containing protein [Verrucomicrobium sp. 3C]
MSNQQEILTRLDKLILEADNLLRSPSPTPPYNVDFGLFIGWKAKCLTFLNNCLSEKHTYVETFKTVADSYRSNVKGGMEILKAFREDVKNNGLRKLEWHISADIFDSFLDSAEYLVEEGYKDPAACLVGAVLEHGLRKLCANHGYVVGSSNNISSLGKTLFENGIINSLTLKDMSAWGDIRNHAVHGEFDQYTHYRVKEMLKNVHDFLEFHFKNFVVRADASS